MEREAHSADSFHLEIDGVSAGSFVRCSGLGARTEVLEFMEGGSEDVHRVRGDTTFSNIILERGVVRNRELYDWFTRGERRDGAVVLLSAEGREIVRWAFVRGWPCRWEGPILDAGRSAIALEFLEIAHEGLSCVER